MLTPSKTPSKKPASAKPWKKWISVEKSNSDAVKELHCSFVKMDGVETFLESSRRNTEGVCDKFVILTWKRSKV